MISLTPTTIQPDYTSEESIQNKRRRTQTMTSCLCENAAKSLDQYYSSPVLGTNQRIDPTRQVQPLEFEMFSPNTAFPLLPPPAVSITQPPGPVAQQIVPNIQRASIDGPRTLAPTLPHNIPSTRRTMINIRYQTTGQVPHIAFNTSGRTSAVTAAELLRL